MERFLIDRMMTKTQLTENRVISNNYNNYKKSIYWYCDTNSFPVIVGTDVLKLIVIIRFVSALLVWFIIWIVIAIYKHYNISLLTRYK